MLVLSIDISSVISSVKYCLSNQMVLLGFVSQSKTQLPLESSTTFPIHCAVKPFSCFHLET